MKKRLPMVLIICILFSFLLTACGETKTDTKVDIKVDTKEVIKADYANAEDFEATLDMGGRVIGKVVSFTVDEVVPDSAYGYNLKAGEHLNFCSEEDPGIAEGDTVTVKVIEITYVMGSYVITYEEV